MPKHKRYHQSSRDRMHERAGMERYEHGREVMRAIVDRPENEYTMRHASGGYLTEDHSQVANLPQHVVYRPYGDPVDYLPQDIDDTIHGIDAQRGLDYRKARAGWYPKKV